MILTRSTRLSQPQGPAEIDYANSLAKGMAWLYLPSVEKELVRSLPITKGGGYTRRAVAGGVGQVLDANSTITTPSASLNSSDTLTMFSVASVKASLVSRPAIVPHVGSGTGSAGSTVVGQTAYAGGGGAGAVVYYSPNYTGQIIASSPGGDFTPGNVVVIVATYRRNDALRVYANGNLRATTAAADYQANLKFHSTVNIGGTSESSTNVIMSGISYRAWSDAEIAEFSANPWQLFRPVQRRVYFDMGAGGGGTTHTVTADPVDQGSTTTRPGLTQTHVTTASAVTQGATVSRPAITQTHVVTARAVVQASTVNAPSIVQTHIVTAMPSVQGATVTRPGLSQTHTVTARAVTQGSVVNAPSVDVGSTPATFVTARPVAQGSTVNTPGIRQTHVTSARAVVHGSTISAPGLVQTHVVAARPVVQASTVRVAGIAPPFVRSMYLAAVPAGEYSATVPAGIFKASI